MNLFRLSFWLKIKSGIVKKSKIQMLVFTIILQ